MQQRPLGKSGINASVVAFGAWAIGGWKWGGTDANDAIAAIESSIEQGINFIDTAAVYGFGVSEELVGKAIASHPRDQLIIATKCGLRWDTTSDTLHYEGDGKSVYRTLTANSVEFEVEQSLKRLDTDYIDLYQTHWPDPTLVTDEVLEGLVRAKQSGKVRSIGFCNASLEMLQAAVATGELDVDQEKYSLLDRERDKDNLPFCEKSALAFLAYSPMAQGLLSGRTDPNRAYNEGDLRIGNPRFSSKNIATINSLLEPLNDVASSHQCGIEHIVLAWTLQQPGVSHVLVGARDAEQAKKNAVAGSIQLSDDELAVVNTAANAWQGFSND